MRDMSAAWPIIATGLQVIRAEEYLVLRRQILPRMFKHPSLFGNITHGIANIFICRQRRRSPHAPAQTTVKVILNSGTGTIVIKIGFICGIDIAAKATFDTAVIVNVGMRISGLEVAAAGTERGQ